MTGAATVLTGATGFLGSRLLLRMLIDTEVHVIVFTRDAPSATGARIVTALRAAGAGAAELAHLDRVEAVRIDLSRPDLDLPPARYAELADRTGGVWHCAATIALGGDAEGLTRVNVQGTRNVLAFAEAGRLAPPVRYVSTAFVAGRRREGTVREDDFDGSLGFENPYEASKFRAESVVAAWAARTGRPTIVFRPSVLVTDRPSTLDAASHPLSVLAALVAGVRARSDIQGDRRAQIAGRADAQLNLVQVEWAAQAMLRAAGHEVAGPLTRYHVVHPHDTPLRLICDVLEERYPGPRIVLGEEPPTAGPTEAYLGVMLAYCHHRRRYERPGLVAATAGLPDPDTIDLAYLRDALDPFRHGDSAAKEAS